MTVSCETSALRIYDIALDGLRPITQKDIDDYGALRRAYGDLREAYKRVQDKLMEDLK